MILGIDEVGRGPWAGPLVVGAVVLDDAQIPALLAAGVTDSKKLSKSRRDSLATKIRAAALGIGLSWVSAGELDALGLSAALRKATRQAVEQIQSPYHQIIIDGTINFLQDTPKGPYVTTLAKADVLIPAVSAAAIMAKVARDRYMEQQDELYPGYGFASHVGYGTAKHRAALESLGSTPLHRQSFAPMAAYPSAQPSSTKFIGDMAERLVAERLKSSGHVIIARNWRTRWCEIDIVSRKGDTVFFCEVKYRRTAQQGGGIAAITPGKQQRMRFAAELFLASYSSNIQAQLLVADVTGSDNTITSLIEIE